MMRVRATQTGVYLDRVYQPGEVFYVEDAFFSDARSTEPGVAKFGWMEKYVEPSVHEPVPVIPAPSLPAKKGWL